MKNLNKVSSTYRTFEYAGNKFFAQKTKAIFSTGHYWMVYRVTGEHKAERFSRFDKWNDVVAHFKTREPLRIIYA